MTTEHATDRPTRIVALLNQKGGVGKTTTTVNLGAAMAQNGRRVCLIDLDPQAHLALHLGIEPDQVDRTVYDLLIDPECSVDQTIITARPNLDVMVAEVDLAGAEQELANRPGRQHRLRDAFAPIAGRYDVVLVDCPPSLGLLTLNALCLAREVFVPMQAHFLALQGVGRLLETVGLVCRSVNPELRVTGIILCMHEGQTTLAKEVVADLDAFFAEADGTDAPWRGCRVLRPSIRRNIKLAEAPSFGNTILDYAPWCPGALDYRRLAELLLREWDGGSPDVEPAARTDAAPADRPARPAEGSARAAQTIEARPEAPEVVIAASGGAAAAAEPREPARAEQNAEPGLGR